MKLLIMQFSPVTSSLLCPNIPALSGKLLEREIAL
jgi:hypothetical protein